MAQALMKDVLKQIAKGVMLYGGPVLGSEPSWGGYSLEQYVDMRLGAMGAK